MSVIRVWEMPLVNELQSRTKFRTRAVLLGDFRGEGKAPARLVWNVLGAVLEGPQRFDDGNPCVGPLDLRWSWPPARPDLGTPGRTQWALSHEFCWRPAWRTPQGSFRT